MVFLGMLGGYVALAAIFYFGMMQSATEGVAPLSSRHHKWHRVRHVIPQGLMRRGR